MIKLTLSTAEQNELLIGLGMLDGRDVVVGDKTVRQPYKLGGAFRRTLVKNVAKLNTSVAEAEKAHRDLVKEIFPDLVEGQSVTRAGHEEAFDRFRAEALELANTKDEFELEPMNGSVLYGDQDFPISVTLLLEKHGLITTES